MKVAIFSPQPSAVWVDKPGWAADGFRQAGHDVRRCHAMGELASADRDRDLILFDQNAGGLHSPDVANCAEHRRATPHNVWAWWQRDLVAMEADKPLAEQCTIQTHGRLLKALDVVFVKERSMLDEYASLGINARWLDQAATSQFAKCEHRERPEFDVLVFGCTDYDQRRSDVLSLVKAGFRVLWLSSYASVPLPSGVTCRPWTHPLDLPAIASRCAVVLGVDWRNDVPGYTSDRTYMAAAMGACYVARVPDFGADSGVRFSAAAELASWVYDDQEQLIRIVREAVANRNERERRGMAARERVLAKHTYRHRAEEIVGIVSELNCREQIAMAARMSC